MEICSADWQPVLQIGSRMRRAAERESAERNLLIFRRDAGGRITGLIERRKFNDLHLARETPVGP